jgi:hypothetical protein
MVVYEKAVITVRLFRVQTRGLGYSRRVMGAYIADLPLSSTANTVTSTWCADHLS